MDDLFGMIDKTEVENENDDDTDFDNILDSNVTVVQRSNSPGSMNNYLSLTDGELEAEDDCEDSEGNVASFEPPAKKSQVEEVLGIDEFHSNVAVLPKSVSLLRKFKRIPIFVVDYHNDVLEFIYRCLGSKHLPFEKNTIIHFDSHPDMVVPRDIPASSCYDKEMMLAELSIENWLMSVCYAGHFNRVIWLKNSWCKQIPVGEYLFQVGEKDDRIRVTSTLDYFVSDGSYCQADELKHVRNIEFYVVDSDGDPAPKPKDLLAGEASKSYILDIDLDFFSTANPFLDTYKHANCYELLREIFIYEKINNNDNIKIVNDERRRLLAGLKNIFQHLENQRNFDGFEMDELEFLPLDIYRKIVALDKILHEHYQDSEIDWLFIFDAGTTIDNNDLPHHISSESDLEKYYQNFREFIKELPQPPVLITIACSAEDDYCPPYQVSHIQRRVVEILQEVFQDKIHEKPIQHHLEDEWDVMRL